MRTAHPLIDMSIFDVPTFRLVLGIVAAVAVAQFARTVFIPLELQSLRGLSPLETGLALLPAAVASAVAMPLGGRWTDRTGGRAPVTLGLVLVVGVGDGVRRCCASTPRWVLVITLMVVNNVGIVLCTMPLVVMGLSAVASRLVPQASALRSLTRQVSGALGTAVLATIITAQVGELTFTDGDAMPSSPTPRRRTTVASSSPPGSPPSASCWPGSCPVARSTAQASLLHGVNRNSVCSLPRGVDES